MSSLTTINRLQRRHLPIALCQVPWDKRKRFRSEQLLLNHSYKNCLKHSTHIISIDVRVKSHHTSFPTSTGNVYTLVQVWLRHCSSHSILFITLWELVSLYILASCVCLSSNTKVSRIRPSGQIWFITCFCKYNCVGTQPHLFFFFLLCMVALALQCWNWVFV